MRTFNEGRMFHRLRADQGRRGVGKSEGDQMVGSRGYRGIGMEGFIARSYDRSAQKYSAGQYREWADRLADLVTEGDSVLEIAPGPGYLSIELARRRACHVTGLEISRTFVEIARRNAREAGTDIEILQGNAASMPFPDGTFDLLFCTSAFKNFREPFAVLREMRRVLKTGGKAWISDLRRDVDDGTIRDFVGSTMGAKGLRGIVMRYTFERILRPRAYTSDQFKEMALGTAFLSVETQSSPIGFEALLQK